MSKSFASFNPQSPTISLNQTPANVYNGTIAANSQVSTPISRPLSQAGPSTWHPPTHWNVSQPTTLVAPGNPVVPKKRTSEEQEITSGTALRIASRLAVDHAAALYPEMDVPFSDHNNILNRLLPYHVFQQPKEDLDFLAKRKGKFKAVSSEAEDELAETKFALDCFKRREALLRRFRKAKISSGKRCAPDDQTYVLAQAVLEADRSETTWLNSELRTARAELERIEREKRLSANTSRTTYYTQAPPPTSSMQPHYYRGYPYTYAQPYGTPVQSSSTSSFSASPVTPSTNYSPNPSSGAIPVQLPVASLPALHALGIVPVPAASLPQDGQPQPPAVLRGSSANGTILSLEINVSLLQSAQMSGLAMVLNSLMTRGGPSLASPSTGSVANGINTGSVG